MVESPLMNGGPSIPLPALPSAYLMAFQGLFALLAGSCAESQGSDVLLFVNRILEPRRRYQCIR